MDNQQIKVWDILVRLFHWSLVAAFTVAYVSDDESDIHAWSGYVVLGLVVFRLLWGLIGTRHARFSDFVTGPRRVLEYLKQLTTGRPGHYVGHNPAGGWMVIALLLSLLATGWSGLEVYAIEEGRGPLAGTSIELSPVATAQADWDEDFAFPNDAGDWWEEIHEFFANLTLLLVFVHVAGVVVASKLHRENLVRAMITGKKNTSAP